MTHVHPPIHVHSHSVAAGVSLSLSLSLSLSVCVCVSCACMVACCVYRNTTNTAKGLNYFFHEHNQYDRLRRSYMAWLISGDLSKFQKLDLTILPIITVLRQYARAWMEAAIDDVGWKRGRKVTFKSHLRWEIRRRGSFDGYWMKLGVCLPRAQWCYHPGRTSVI